MAWLRKRRAPRSHDPIDPRLLVPIDDPADDAIEHVRVLETRRGGDASPPTQRVERMIAVCVAHIAQLEDRLAASGREVAELRELLDDHPDHADLLEVRLHSARVSSEVSRLATELRAEIAEIKDESDRTATGSRDRATPSRAAAQSLSSS